MLFSGSGIEVAWVSKHGEEIDPDWFASDQPDVLVVIPDNAIPAGGSAWFTVTFKVLVKCPGPLPVQFTLGYDQLAGRPPSACQASRISATFPRKLPRKLTRASCGRP